MPQSMNEEGWESVANMITEGQSCISFLFFELSSVFPLQIHHPLLGQCSFYIDHLIIFFFFGLKPNPFFTGESTANGSYAHLLKEWDGRMVGWWKVDEA